ncbi:MAG: hypothetical protein AAGC60_29565 [Acidobacteriota bacterium]
MPITATAKPEQATANELAGRPTHGRRASERRWMKSLRSCWVRSGSYAWLVSAVVTTVVAWMAVPALGAAQDGRFSSTRTESSRAQTHRAQNQHLLSGLGSAANVAPGWYSRNLSQPVVEGGALVAPFVQPFVPLQLSQVVVVQQPAPVVVEAPPPQVVYIEREPEPRPQPLPPTPRSAPTPRRTPDPELWPAQPAAPAPPPTPRSTDPQALRLQITPADAVVHLDDEPLGAAADLPASLQLEPGVYVLEVSHSALPPQRLVFGVADEAISIAVDLAADRPSRRARVR